MSLIEPELANYMKCTAEDLSRKGLFNETCPLSMPMIRAVVFKRYDLIKDMVENYNQDVNAVASITLENNCVTVTPLIAALMLDDGYRLVKFLLDLGANINQVVKQWLYLPGTSFFISKGSWVTVSPLAFVLQCKTHSKRKHFFCEFVLGAACRQIESDCINYSKVMFLLDHGADPNQILEFCVRHSEKRVSKYFSTPLLRAIGGNICFEGITYLLYRGADMSTKGWVYVVGNSEFQFMTAYEYITKMKEEVFTCKYNTYVNVSKGLLRRRLVGNGFMVIPPHRMHTGFFTTFIETKKRMLTYQRNPCSLQDLCRRFIITRIIHVDNSRFKRYDVKVDKLKLPLSLKNYLKYEIIAPHEVASK